MRAHRLITDFVPVTAGAENDLVFNAFTLDDQDIMLTIGAGLQCPASITFPDSVINPTLDFIANRDSNVNVQVDNGTGATGEVAWTNASAPATPAAGNVTCTEDTAAPGYGLFRYQLDRYSGYRAVPTMTRARVVPSTAYPSTAYGTDFVLDRAGF